MAYYKYKYIITSERVACVVADNEDEAKAKVEKIMTENSEIDAIKKIEENYINTIADTHLGVDFGSFCKAPIGYENIVAEDELE